MSQIARAESQLSGGLLCSIFIEGGIFVSHAIWLFRTRKLRKSAKVAGKTFDDLPESEEYHVEMPRKGSIAASRDVQKIEVERRGSVAVARDLERGEEILQASVDYVRSASVVKPMDTLSEVSSTKGIKDTAVRVTEEEIKDEGADTVDYGTMASSGPSESRTRPGYVRQDSTASQTLFKDPQWRK